MLAKQGPQGGPAAGPALSCNSRLFYRTAQGRFVAGICIYGTDELQVLMDNPCRVCAHGAAGVRRGGGAVRDGLFEPMLTDEMR